MTLTHLAYSSTGLCFFFFFFFPLFFFFSHCPSFLSLFIHISLHPSPAADTLLNQVDVSTPTFCCWTCWFFFSFFFLFFFSKWPFFVIFFLYYVSLSLFLFSLEQLQFLCRCATRGGLLRSDCNLRHMFMYSRISIASEPFSEVGERERDREHMG